MLTEPSVTNQEVVDAINALTEEIRRLRQSIANIWAIPVPVPNPSPQPWVPPVPMPYWQNPVISEASQVSQGAATRTALWNR